jgi:uncharacterized pyridoxal phosphate-containing UPF0001 family protein
MASIRDNLLRVLERMDQAARRTGRDPGDVKLVGASKTVETARIREAIEAGVTILGENYVQEARKKIEEIGHGIQWHMVGHLQSNKAKYAVTLSLVEVNLSKETSKFGVDEEAATDLIRHVAALKNITIEGLMTMPPYFDEPEKARPYFNRLREFRDRIEKEAVEGVRMDELSMGMSGDFEAAIEEGATIIRVGTAIFGERRY